MSPARATEPDRKWGAFIDFEGKVGTKRNLGEADLFMPLWQNEHSMLFGDARFKGDDQNSWEGNFGLGARHMLPSGWNVGGYGFYDHRRSPNANFFDQLTFGAELLGTDFDFRANTYWPVGNTVSPVGGPTTSMATASISGSALLVNIPAVTQAYEYALRGFDAEAGVRIPILPASSPYNLRFYAGGFRFDDAAGIAPVVAGPRLRLEFTSYAVPGLWNGSRLSVGGEWQTDSVRGSQFFAGLRLRVPLEAEPRRGSLTMQEQRMTDSIVRDVDIVASMQTSVISPAIKETATMTADGRTITTVDSSSTTGANLPTVVANAGANSFVIMQGTFNTTAVTTLQSGQTVMGSGLLPLRTASGRIVTASLPGATISAVVGGPAVSMANSSTVTGLTISNTTTGSTGASGVQASGVTDVTISNNTISANSTGSNNALGVNIIGTSTVTVSGNRISATATAGNAANAFVLNSITATATVSGNTFDASGGTANAVAVGAGTINTAASTGNVIHSGGCSATSVTGHLSFTDGTTCP